MPTADPARVRAVVASSFGTGSRRRGTGRTVVAIDAEPIWSGPDLLDGTPPIRVVAVRSPLAAREAVVRHEETGRLPGAAGEEILVLLTSCTSAELGLDLQARLAKGAVQAFDPFASVLALFGAQVLDPALADERWLIDDLISLAPAAGWVGKAPFNGVLDAEVAWATWQEARLGVGHVPSTLGEVLELVERPHVRRSLGALSDQARGRVGARWAQGWPAAAALIVDLASSGSPMAATAVSGTAVSATALGLVVGLLWAATDDAALAQRQVIGRARLEPLLGRDRLGPLDAAAWAEASLDRVGGPGDRPTVFADAQGVLADIDAMELSVLSDVLPSGFEARLDALGRALGSALGGDDLAPAMAASASVQRHVLAPRRARRVTAGLAAVRLLRWERSSAAPGAPSSFADLAVGYRDELAWVEQARRDLAAGEQSAPLAAAFGRLAEEAAAAQHSAARGFATALVEWSKSAPAPDDRLVVVEDLLGAVVAPVARDAPVLVVICDGMGLSVSHQLVADLAVEGWAPASPGGCRSWPVGVAALPTVTSVSRTSLLCGRLCAGAQAEERSGFASHPALRQAGRSDRPPVLFHKAGLVAADGAALPEGIRAAVADPDQRVVGAVVNSVDDHLARGDQINVGWDLASLGPLGWLLDAAAEASRVVIITADHGHVLDTGRSLARPQAAEAGEGGERWRSAASAPRDGEIAIAGPRVGPGGGEVVLAVDERLRYGPPKHGYHGGATPEEVLVPVEVLARRLPPGWAYQPVATPPWWDGTEAAAATAAGVTVAPTATDRTSTGTTSTGTTSTGTTSTGTTSMRTAKPKPGPSPQPSLFVPEPAPAAVPAARPTDATWVDALLRSPAFCAQRAAVRLPRPLPDDRLRRYLEAIAANGGTIAMAALAATTGEPPGTLRMTLSVVQRLVNRDGAAVLAVGGDGTISCNLDLLALQFDLDLVGLAGGAGR